MSTRLIQDFALEAPPPDTFTFAEATGYGSPR